MDETMQYKGTGWDLEKLSGQIEHKLMEQGYDVQSNVSRDNIIIQAKKAGVLRDIITANRAFTIALAGKPDDFSVRVGVGKMVQNLGVAAAEAVLLSELFLVVDVPEMIWTQYVHNGIVKEIEGIVGSKPSKRTMGKARTAMRGVGTAVGAGKNAGKEAGEKVAKAAKKAGKKVKKKMKALA